MSELRAGDIVEFTVKAEVVCRYESGRVKIRWDSGETITYSSDTRINDE